MNLTVEGLFLQEIQIFIHSDNMSVQELPFSDLKGFTAFPCSQKFHILDYDALEMRKKD